MKTVKFAVAALVMGATLTASAAKVDSLPDFMRSSIYTFIIRSNFQDQKIDKNVPAGQPKMSTMAHDAFLNIPNPDQFNEHNLDLRILDFDAYQVTPEEIEAANATIGKKKESGFSKFGKSLAKEGLKSMAASNAQNNGGKATDTDAIMGETDTVDVNLAAVLNKHMQQQAVAANLVGKWFGYNINGDNKYDENNLLIAERGGYAARTQDIKESQSAADKQGVFSRLGEQMIPNTFVLAINLRYRSTKELVGQIGGLLGGAAMQQTVDMAGVDGYSVQAISYLYQLEWNDSIQNVFYNDYYDKSLEELAASGLCKVKFIGKTQDRATVGSIGKSGQSESLIRRAVARSIDKTIVKLQKEYEQFRTNAPITKVEDGYVYAEIGMKEGLVKGDKYDILEKQEDETGKVTYNKVGTVEPDEKMIWDNRYGANESIEGEDKEEASDSKAVALGASAFKCKKKDVYPGMFLRLAKKK